MGSEKWEIQYPVTRKSLAANKKRKKGAKAIRTLFDL
jgi:hypothetical protein